MKLGWDVFQELRELPFPTIAMVHGFCMGGGVELALACRYRVALDDPKTRFALPEVMLGIVPAWDGVQWLPKLVGPAAALDMMLTGRASMRAARSASGSSTRRCRCASSRTPRAWSLCEAPPQQQAAASCNRLMLPARCGASSSSQARKQVAKRARREHYPAPYAILELWRKYDGNPFAASQRPVRLGRGAVRASDHART